MHIVDGKTGTRSPIIHHKCPALRRMYVPIDESLRFLLLVNPGPIPHNHPIPPMCKASFEAKVAYEGCINAAGTAGVTVQKVDNGEYLSFPIYYRWIPDFAGSSYVNTAYAWGKDARRVQLGFAQQTSQA